MTTVSYASIFDAFLGLETTSAESTSALEADQSSLDIRLKNILKKNAVKKFLTIEDESVDEYLKKIFSDITEETKMKIGAIYPSLSFEGLNSIENIYKFLSDMIKAEVKSGVDSDIITNDAIESIRFQFAPLGITIPEINVSRNMSEEELDKVCLHILDAIDQITDSYFLDLFSSVGVNIKKDFENFFGNKNEVK
jgi:hypothetical protein